MIDRMNAWMAALEARQLRDLTFQEVSRSLRALSSTYVERRAKLREGAALSGAGKRAAFALFYGPLHFLLIRHIVSTLGEPFTAIATLIDLGCGTGASGAGWAAACPRPPVISGIDRHPWAIEEARRTFADLELRGTFRVDDLTRVDVEGRRDGRGTSRRVIERGRRSSTGVLLAFAVNELADGDDRGRLLAQLMEHARAGGHVLIVEPLAGGVAPWWNQWRDAFEGVGGREHQWRVRSELPAIVEKLDRAAGLNHQEIKGRSLSI